MAGKYVGIDTTLTTPASTDYIPLVRPGDTTARHTTIGAVDTYLAGSVYNVKDYGALGDSTTDDTTALSSALSAALGADAVLYLPKGNYNLSALSAAYSLNDSIVIKGDGAGLTTLTGGAAKKLFDLTGSGIKVHLEGMTFDTWDDVVTLDNLTGDLDRFVVKDCAFNSVVRGITDDTDTYIKKDVIIQGNRFTTVSENAVYLKTDRIEFADISHNYFNGITWHAIWCGDDGYFAVASDERYQFTITNNRIYDVNSGAVTTGCRGIIAFGNSVLIEGNVLRNIRSDAGTNTEGIYTKTVFGLIANNILYDAGQNEGMIAIKGQRRGTTAAALGHSVRVDGNILYSTGTLSPIPVNGIGVKNDDVLVTNNYIEGQFSSRAISVAEGTDVRVSGNWMRNISGGQYAVQLVSSTGTLQDVWFLNNHIIGQTTNTTSGGALYVNNGSSNAVDNIHIVGNEFRDLAGSAADAGVTTSFSIATTGFVITNNYFDTMDYGIRFLSTAPSDVELWGNRFVSVGTRYQNLANVTTKVGLESEYAGVLSLTDGVAEPTAIVGRAQIYVDTADGDLKVKFGDGTVAVIAADT